MKMIIGLGNPGKEYAQTKHNVGFMVIDAIADDLNVAVEKKQCQALTQTANWDGQKILLVKPQTFMNLSGQAVMELLHYYNDRIDDLLVIHDDLDLPPGQLRFKQGGGAGGHNGIKNTTPHRKLTGPFHLFRMFIAKLYQVSLQLILLQLLPNR